MQWTKIKQLKQGLSEWHLCHSVGIDALTMSKQLMTQENLSLGTKGAAAIITVHLKMPG